VDPPGHLPCLAGGQSTVRVGLQGLRHESSVRCRLQRLLQRIAAIEASHKPTK
jgi:hypothetical protein